MTYIIGEIGQNHSGKVENAIKLIDEITKPIIDECFNRELKGLDAVKLTLRDNNNEATDSFMNAHYNSINSFGNTYKEHREALELSHEEHKVVYEHAKLNGLQFIETVCHPSCLDILKLFKPDRIKIASRDLTNLTLLREVAKTKIPMIISTGMARNKDISMALKVIQNNGNPEVSILHCVSQYPADYEGLSLKMIDTLRMYGKEVGYSDHSIGIVVPTVAVSLGATIIEKHITLDRTQKGTDHAGSLEPQGLRRMIRDIRNIEKALLYRPKQVQKARQKLERSIAVNKDIKKGEVITAKDIHMLSPGTGLREWEAYKMLDKKANKDINKNELI